MEKLTPAQKKILATQIKSLDLKGEIVALSPNADFTAGSIAYNKESGIIFGERTYRLTDEEYVRAWLVVRLIRNFKYPANRIELEHTYTIGRPSPTSAQVDIRIHALDSVFGTKEKVFMLIEAKRPDDFDSYEKNLDGQLFETGQTEVARGLRYAVWHSVEFHGDEPRDKCIVIDFKEFTEFRAWVAAGELGHNLDLPPEYGTVRKTKFIKGGKRDLRADLTRADFTRLQRDFHNRLWGGAKMGDTDVFKNLLKMFIAKIHDESGTDEGKAYRFQSELKDGRPETADEIWTKVNRLYQDAMGHYFGLDEEALSHERLNKEQFSANKVAYVMEKLEAISITENKFEDDVLGAFFEAIVRTGFKQEKGQFFTHTNIVRFVLHALDLDLDIIERINANSPTIPHIIDPSCGSGTFLIEAMKLITASVLHPRLGAPPLSKAKRPRDFVQEYFQPNAENHNIQNRWARQFIYGVEANADLALATKVNMIVHGDGNANIFKNDGLAAFAKYEPTKDNLNTRLQLEDGSGKRANHPYKPSCNEQFDVVVGNPPFSLKDDPRTLNEYGGRFCYAGKKNSENLFIERWFQLLKPGGRLGVVLPDSVFDTNENLYMRLFLYRFFFIKSVVSLPQVAFQPYTPTKTSLLFAVKKRKTEIEAWDAAWSEATNEYGKLRRSEIIKVILTNDRLRATLIDMANRSEVEWYPASNLLTATTLPAAVRAALVDACEDSAGQKRKLTKLLEDFDTFTAAGPLADCTGAEEKATRATLARLLRDKAPANCAKLPLRDLLEAAYDDLVAAAELNHTEDPRGENYCNAWWCFAEVTARPDFDYPIFFAEAGQVGYKRTTRHPEGIEQPNDLFATDADGNIVIDTENPKTILDHLRSQKLFTYGNKS
jgi:type I restriction enzyme M protein